MAARRTAWSSISRRVPEWVLARPYTLVAVLRWLNAFRRYRWLVPACALGAVGVFWATTRAQFGSALEVAWAHWGLVVVASGAWSYFTAHRRRVRIAVEDAYSWLSPLPVPRSRVLRMTLPPGLQLLVIGVLLAGGALSGSHSAVAWKLFLLFAGCFVAGLLLGSLTKPAHAAVPNSQYVRARYPRSRWSTAPALTPLSYWVSGQARVFLKPQVAARAALPVLLSLPMGVSGNDALGMAAAALVVLGLTAYTVAGLRVAFGAGAWLSPTCVDRRRFAVAVGSAVVLTQALSCLALLFLGSAVAPGAVIWRLSAAAVVFVAASAVLIAVAVRFAFRPEVVARVRTLAWLQ